MIYGYCRISTKKQSIDRQIRNISLVFLKERHIDTEAYREAMILKYSKDFDGTLSDKECMKLIGLANNTYYKYKRELKEANGLVAG